MTRLWVGNKNNLKKLLSLFRPTVRHRSVFKHPGDGKEAGFSISDQFPNVILGYVMFQIQRKLVEEAPACTRGPGVLSSACGGKASLSRGCLLPRFSGCLLAWEPPRLGPLSCFGCSGLAVVTRLYGLRASVLLGAADGLGASCICIHVIIPS